MKGVCLQYVAELYLTRELSRLFNALKSDLMSFKGIKFLESADQQMYTTTVDFKLISLGLKRRLSADEQFHSWIIISSQCFMSDLTDQDKCVL